VLVLKPIQLELGQATAAVEKLKSVLMPCMRGLIRFIAELLNGYGCSRSMSE
jgi:hypothetical protein